MQRLPIYPTWQDIANGSPDPAKFGKLFQEARGEVLDQQRRIKEGRPSSSAGTVTSSAGAEDGTIAGGFMVTDVRTIGADSPLVAAIDSASALLDLGTLAFKLGKEQHADVSSRVIADLVAAKWTRLEFEYATAFIAQTSDEETLKEIRFARVIGNLLYNFVRTKRQVRAGRLHTIAEAVGVSNADRRPIRDLFAPVTIAGGNGEVLYMLTSF